MTVRSVAILGSTGSIGTQALDVISRHPERFTVQALAAGGGSVDTLITQARSFHVQAVGVADETVAAHVSEALPDVHVYAGDDAATTIAAGYIGAGEAAPADVVLNGMAGSVGLRPTLAALEAGSLLALANKESLIAGGALVHQAVQYEGQIVPVDSEHSAMAQALRSGTEREVSRLILTASGGAFRGRSRASLADVTAKQALQHPTWDMGPVVTINSATMVNKALELLEAHLLFGVELKDIHVVVHPQSQIHSMVEFRDGATIAQASPPDMRLPIALGLSWPERLAEVSPSYDWSVSQTWTFEPLDDAVFPAVRLMREAAAASPLHPAVYNAANEECVAAFLAGNLGFLDIVDTVEKTLSDYSAPAEVSLGAVEEAQRWARESARRSRT